MSYYLVRSKLFDNLQRINPVNEAFKVSPLLNDCSPNLGLSGIAPLHPHHSLIVPVTPFCIFCRLMKLLWSCRPTRLKNRPVEMLPMPKL